MLSGQRPAGDEGGQFQLMERSYGPFRRTFDLGSMTDVEGISASYRHGVLTIHVPKREERGRRALAIES